MKRREFILLAGGAVAWPITARPQQPDGVRRVGTLMNQAETDSEAQEHLAAFVQRLQRLGWTDGRNLRIDSRWGAGDADRIRRYAGELVGLAPDVILSNGSAGMPALLRATRTVPIVFVNVADPVSAGFVDSLSQPGGNATGFIQFEYTVSGKWLELLKEIAPGVKRAAVLRDANITAGTGQLGVIQSVAASIGVEVSPINMHDAAKIERSIAEFARSSDGGLILTASALAVVHRKLIIALA